MLRHRSVIWLLAATLIPAGLCAAQEKAPKKKREREARTPMVREMGIRDTNGFFDQMKEELRLTESQEREIKKLIDDYNKEVETAKSAVPPSPESGKEYAETREQLEKARQSGDQAQQKLIIDQMKARHQKELEAEAPYRVQIETAQQTLHDQIKAKLGDKQRPDFDWIWEDATSGRRRPGDINPKALRASVMRLPDLTSDQKKKLDELFKDNDKEAEKSGSKDGRPGDRRRINQKLNEDVMAVLTKDQKAKITEEMNKRTAQSRRKPRAAQGS